MRILPRSFRKSQAFSLIEVAMALGIFSFAVMGLLGLMPAAVTTHKEAKNSTVLSQIKQRLAAEVMLTDGASLTALNGFERKFDNEGRELDASEADKTVYRAQIQLDTFQAPGASATSTSLQRVVLYAVIDPTPNAAILNKAVSDKKASGSLLVSKAASF